MELFAYIMLIVMSVICLLLLWLLRSANKDLSESLELNELLLLDNEQLVKQNIILMLKHKRS
ncbi:hypothetical protein HMPREF9715_00897 [Myroides odoratimimus CIP 101113]|uniref:Uncharacterized protein n=1 Tax=Myroides odoratimimus CIP 101113 TaxID=883154 RepID=A0AAV3F5A5_9FLAO|nr:hypothetical protein HMPREF9715_00897 [Myroides odoratimimus CIP 101113]